MGKIVCITYGTDPYKKEMKLNIKTAKKYGADEAKAFTINDIDSNYIKLNERFFKEKRGGGYWLWKPYIIDKCLTEMNVGDWLFYVDAGLFYLNNIKDYIKKLETNKITLVMAPTVHEEYKYTKRDVFVKTETDLDYIKNSLQRQSGAIIIKKNDENIELIKQWLKYIQIDSLVSDAPNIYGKDNYEGFIENRHDQSILSVLSKKMNIGTDESLYDGAIDMFHSKKPLCYHHSMCGNKYLIYFKARIRKLINKFRGD